MKHLTTLSSRKQGTKRHALVVRSGLRAGHDPSVEGPVAPETAPEAGLKIPEEETPACFPIGTYRGIW